MLCSVNYTNHLHVPCLSLHTVPEAPPKPPAVNETVDIVINRPPEESVVTVTLRWMTPEVTGGPLQSYDVLLVALGIASTDGEPRRRRQTDDFLANCIVTGVNNTFTVPVNTTQLDVTAGMLN